MRGQLERGAEPIDPDFYARWLKSKGSLDEAEMCIRAHAAWREAFVARGRIMEVLLGPLSVSLSNLEKCCKCDRFKHPGMPLEGCVSCVLRVEQTVCPSHPFQTGGCSMAVLPVSAQEASWLYMNFSAESKPRMH